MVEQRCARIWPFPLLAFSESHSILPSTLPRHVAVFLPTLVGGGAERVMLNLAHGLHQRGYRVDLVLAQAEGAFLPQIPKTLSVVVLNSWRLRGFRTFAALPLLVSYLRSAKPEVLLAALPRANIVSVWARQLSRIRVRTVITVHELQSRQVRKRERLYVRLMSWLARRVYPAADAIIAVSNGVAEELASALQGRRDQIRVIPNPVLTPELREKAEQWPAHRWFEPGAPPIIVSVGRLEPPKDFSTLLRAFAELRQRRDVRLLILGDGPERAGLATLIRQLRLSSDVEMIGFTANPYPFIAHASLLVLSSGSEALPTVLIEALYLGTPVVAANCPTGPKEILADGRYGRLVPVGDHKALVRAMDESLSIRQPRPPEESWSSFTLESATSLYAEVLFGNPPVLSDQAPVLHTR